MVYSFFYKCMDWESHRSAQKSLYSLFLLNTGFLMIVFDSAYEILSNHRRKTYLRLTFEFSPFLGVRHSLIAVDSYRSIGFGRKASCLKS